MTDEPVILNEEISRKYDSYSSAPAFKTSTLEEPVIDTIVMPALLRRETSWTSISRHAPLSAETATTTKSNSNGTYGDPSSFPSSRHPWELSEREGP
jgi:hypothetical protein